MGILVRIILVLLIILLLFLLVGWVLLFLVLREYFDEFDRRL